ncbi:helix-turn-helix transcriptional regulator [Rhizobium sp. Leaf341]|uniref:helix-turn-helix transcriptional regulator n=1 Tax=Rhizobium sp. Leaf341 TaxID=1736344 RepID=UPI0007147CC8|nr:LuxR family transcriptional regulator [Rhizobium sp. Leaf341]KQR77486.1 hypothetical protein ASG03_13760 [Rhizobium sp. Leaf341]
MSDAAGIITSPIVSFGSAPSDAASDIAEIARLSSREDIIAFMARITRDRGFPYFSLFTLPTADQTRYSQIVVLSNVPEDIMQLYEEGASPRDDAAFILLRTTTTPFRMVVQENASDPNKVLTEDHAPLARDLGIRGAFFFPVHDAAGGRAVFVLLSPSADLAVEDMTDLHMICLCVYNRLVNSGGMDGHQKKVDLSEREIQCLNWTAAGKTSSEIAEILGLSEHTVNHYLNHVAKKLDAVNRIQAVVKAMRLGLIS